MGNPQEFLHCIIGKIQWIVVGPIISIISIIINFNGRHAPIGRIHLHHQRI